MRIREKSPHFYSVEGRTVIHVTRLNQSSIVLNCELIEQIESTPDTLITLTNNQKFIVLETADEIVERIQLYRRSILPAHAARPAQITVAGGDSN